MNPKKSDAIIVGIMGPKKPGLPAKRPTPFGERRPLGAAKPPREVDVEEEEEGTEDDIRDSLGRSVARALSRADGAAIYDAIEAIVAECKRGSSYESDEEDVA